MGGEAHVTACQCHRQSADDARHVYARRPHLIELCPELARIEGSGYRILHPRRDLLAVDECGGFADDGASGGGPVVGGEQAGGAAEDLQQGLIATAVDTGVSTLIEGEELGDALLSSLRAEAAGVLGESFRRTGGF